MSERVSVGGVRASVLGCIFGGELFLLCSSLASLCICLSFCLLFSEFAFSVHAVFLGGDLLTPALTKKHYQDHNNEHFTHHSIVLCCAVRECR